MVANVSTVCISQKSPSTDTSIKFPTHFEYLVFAFNTLAYIMHTRTNRTLQMFYRNIMIHNFFLLVKLFFTYNSQFTNKTQIHIQQIPVYYIQILGFGTQWKFPRLT